MKYGNHLANKEVIDGLTLDHLYTMAETLLQHNTEQWFDSADCFMATEFESALFGDIEIYLGDQLEHSEEVEISYELSEWWEDHPERLKHNQ